MAPHRNNICFIRLLRPYIFSFLLVQKMDYEESNIAVPMIDSLRFLGPVCDSICGILEYMVWLEKLEITTNLAIPVLIV